MNVTRERACYNALTLVYRGGTYSAQALDAVLSDNVCDEKEFVSRLFYGVLERDISLEYIINRLVSKSPKQSIMIVLKMGTYMVRYMNVADYAAVDRCVELVKSIGKGGVGGFVNAVLRKVGTVELPRRGSVQDAEYLSVNYGLPEWLAIKLLDEYGFGFTEAMMRSEEYRTHIRLKNTVNIAEFEKNISKFEKCDICKSKYGYYVTHNTLKNLKDDFKLKGSDYTVQSLASIAAVHCYADGLSCKSKVLDLCAAPGGKSVCLYELTGSEITACDIHPHRVDLIKSYARRMGADIRVELNDACVERGDWSEKFDCVICDVPCSGTGDLRSKPDILLNRKPSSVIELTKLQSKILRTAAKYVRNGGRLCYSTCSILREENEVVIEKFLSNNSDFCLTDCSHFAKVLLDENIFGSGKGSEFCVEDCGVSGEINSAEHISNKCVRLFPHLHKTDGFFVAVMQKVALPRLEQSKGGVA